MHPAAALPGTAKPQIPKKFDIQRYGRTAISHDGALQASKALVLDGERIGMVELSFGDGAGVWVDRAGLAAILDAHDPRLGETLERFEADLVALDALRSRDVRIRYEPVSDALVIETASQAPAASR